MVGLEVPSAHLRSASTTLDLTVMESLDENVVAITSPIAPMKQYMKAKFRVGSCKGAMNFKPDELIFHSDDIAPSRRARRQEILKWKESKILPPGRPPQWNISVEKFKHPPRRSRVHSEGGTCNLYQYNYRAEVLPQPPPACETSLNKFQVTLTAGRSALAAFDGCADTTRRRLVEQMPIHPKLADSKAWNASVVLTPSEKRKHYATVMLGCTTKPSNAMTRRALAAYRSPEMLARTREEEIRKMKLTGPFDPRTQTAPSSLPAMAAAVSGSQRLKGPNVVRKYKHTGVWEFREAEGLHMWSDTGSNTFDSRGDQVTVFDRCALNVASPW